MRLKIILALALTPCFVGATPEQKHGIFWYETPPKNPTEITQDEYPKPVVPDAETLFKMHPKQIKKLLNDTLEYAVYALTPEATLDYYKVQDAMRRKSAAFTNLAGYVMLQKPGMNGAMDYPVTKPGKGGMGMLCFISPSPTAHIAYSNRKYCQISSGKPGGLSKRLIFCANLKPPRNST